MKKRMVIMLIVLVLLFGGIFGFEAFKNVMIKNFIAKTSNPPQTVSTIKAVEKPWRQTLEAVASLRAHSGADLSPQVAGIVDSIHFKSGQDVKKGQLLISLNAQADLAKLDALKAAQHIASVTYDRDQRQYKAQAISQQVVDSDAANLKQAQANVAQQQALVDYKSIRAPFSGRLGIRQVDIGQYLNPGTTIVTLQSLDPIYADFYQPQQTLEQIKVGQKVVAKTDVLPGETFDGDIVAISPKVDTGTLNVQIRAALKNPDRKLLTGMYATVDVITGAPHTDITLPQTAITYNPYGDTVYLVVPANGEKSEQDNGEKGEKDGQDNGGKLTAKQQFVTVGDTRGDQIQILKGVNVGQTVVTAGQIKLHNGSPIEINNQIQPSDDTNPTPQEH